MGRFGQRAHPAERHRRERRRRRARGRCVLRFAHKQHECLRTARSFSSHAKDERTPAVVSPKAKHLFVEVQTGIYLTATIHSCCRTHHTRTIMKCISAQTHFSRPSLNSGRREVQHSGGNAEAAVQAGGRPAVRACNADLQVRAVLPRNSDTTRRRRPLFFSDIHIGERTRPLLR